MAGEKGNYVADIHNTGYKKEFLDKPITHETMIYDWKREKELLDGDWNYAVDQYDSFLRARWFEKTEENEEGLKYPLDFDYENWDSIRVPSTWNTQIPELTWYEGPVLYTRTFPYEPEEDGERVFIKVGAANYKAFVFLNGLFLGSHVGGSTPFYVEVTGKLEKDNRITISVDNTRDRSGIPMDNTDWFNYGGIYRSVELIRVPRHFIKDLFVSLVPDGTFSNIRIETTVDGPDCSGHVRVEIPDLDIEEDIPLNDGSGAVTLRAKPDLWSPENPVLYPVAAVYKDDEVYDEIGFREIKTQGTEVLLNGEPLFFRGISLHEDSFENGKAVSPNEFLDTLKTAMDLGCNYIRLAHYPHNSEFARLADMGGIMLWEEIPVYWAVQFADEDTYRNAANQISELVLKNRNRAGTVIWSVGNENADTDERLEFMSSLAARVRDLDDTRLVSAACLVNHRELKIDDRLAGHLDIIGINEYYGWYYPDFEELPKILENSNPDKPVFITEFGAGALAGRHGTKTELFTEEHQAEVYRRQIETLDSIEYIAGMSPWILYDFRCPRRTNKYQKYFNRKGLVAEDRKTRKAAFYELQDYYESFMDDEDE